MKGIWKNIDNLILDPLSDRLFLHVKQRGPSLVIFLAGLLLTLIGIFISLFPSVFIGKELVKILNLKVKFFVTLILSTTLILLSIFTFKQILNHSNLKIRIPYQVSSPIENPKSLTCEATTETLLLSSDNCAPTWKWTKEKTTKAFITHYKEKEKINITIQNQTLLILANKNTFTKTNVMDIVKNNQEVLIATSLNESKHSTSAATLVLDKQRGLVTFSKNGSFGPHNWCNHGIKSSSLLYLCHENN